MIKDGRSIAFSVLNKLEKKNHTLDSILDDFFRSNPGIDKRERNLANVIVFGVLRWRARLDYVIDGFAKTGVENVNPEILNIIRIGLFQILYLDRIPESAAVNTAVDMATKLGGKRISGFVNGILRNILRNLKDVEFPDIKADPALAISVEKSFPQWLVNKWIDRFGTDETLQLCDAINTIPPITIRANTLKTDREALKNQLETEADNIRETAFARQGLSFEKPAVSIPELGAFKNGMFQVQDEAAQLVAELLAPKPEESILDACAGLGGKTGHIAQLMKNKGRVFAADTDGRKLKSLRTEMERLGVEIVKTRQMDLNQPLKTEDLPLFDRILVDAPCTGSGVIRRNPDAKWALSGKDLKAFGKKQLGILSNLSGLLKKSGVMVYAVCSTEPEENEAVIEAFLKKHKDFAIDTELENMDDACRSFVNDKGCLKTFPHKNDMDGFFAVRLKKTV